MSGTLKFYKDYNKDINKLLKSLSLNQIETLKTEIKKRKNKKNASVYILGNGGSISTANHITVDLIKNAKVNARSLYNDNLITCFSNDYGSDNWMKKYLEYYCNKDDFVIFLSVSGKSKNILNAAKFCKKNSLNFFSMTGMNKRNPLNNISKNKIWISSKSYNKVEIIHFIILASIVDKIIGKDVYTSSL